MNFLSGYQTTVAALEEAKNEVRFVLLLKLEKYYDLPNDWSSCIIIVYCAEIMV